MSFLNTILVLSQAFSNEEVKMLKKEQEINWQHKRQKTMPRLRLNLVNIMVSIQISLFGYI